MGDENINPQNTVIHAQENKATDNKPSLLNLRKTIFITLLIVLIIGISLSFVLFFNSNRNSNSKKYTPISKNALFVPDEIIVKYKKDYTNYELEVLINKLSKLNVLSQQKVYVSSNDPVLKRYYLLKLRKDTDIAKLQETLSRFEEIEAIEPNNILKTQGVVPNDPYYPQLWGLSKIDMEDAWDITKGSGSIVVAIVDSGIDYDHIDIPVNVIRGVDFATCDQIDQTRGRCLRPKTCPQLINSYCDDDPMDDNGHGTHVSGTIGALVNNNLGISGINWNVGLMAVKVMGADGQGSVTDIRNGIIYAVDRGAKIINLSLSGSGRCGLWQDTINYANAKGAVVVVAAGNNDSDASTYNPGNCNGVITVGASTSLDTRASFSNYGSVVEIAAPGVGILSTVPTSSVPLKNKSTCPSTLVDGKYCSINGTSMATSYVAGVAALLLSANPNFTPQQVRDCIINNANLISTDRLIGPRLNAFKALTVCTGGILPTSTPTPTPTPTPTLSSGITSTLTSTLPPGAPTPTSQDGGSGWSSPTPTPATVVTYKCGIDQSKCPKGEKNLQLCPLICIPQ